MKNIAIRAAAALLAVSAAARADETALRESLKQQAETLLLRGDLAAMDRVASDLRQSRRRTPAGIWSLSLFYKGIERLPQDGDDPAWQKADGDSADWLKAHPDSAAAVVLRSLVLTDRAWAYRGHGYADSMTRAAYLRFRDQLERARDVLDQNKAVGSTDPQWYAERIGIANWQGDDKEAILKLADEALQREPDYQPVLYAASNAMLPKWDGSAELQRRFVAMALARSRPQDGTQAYARIYFNIARYAGNARTELAANGAEWPALQRSAAEISAAYPDPYNLNVERYMTCFEGSPAEYRAVMQRVGTQLESVDGSDDDRYRQDCSDWAYKGKVFDNGNNRAAKLAAARQTSRWVSGIITLAGIAWALLALVVVVVLERRARRRR